jgi:preprotein translocase SecE subunit
VGSNPTSPASFHQVKGADVQKDDSTWLNIALAGFGLCVALVVWKGFTALSLSYGWTERFEAWLPAALVIGSLFVGGVAVWWLRADAGRNEYFLSCIGELRKVSWPSMDDTRKMTMIVCVVVVIFSIILTVFDVIWARLLKMLIV